MTLPSGIRIDCHHPVFETVEVSELTGNARGTTGNALRTSTAGNARLTSTQGCGCLCGSTPFSTGIAISSARNHNQWPAPGRDALGAGLATSGGTGAGGPAMGFHGGTESVGSELRAERGGGRK